MENYKFPPAVVEKYPSLQKWNDGERTMFKDGREQALLQYIKTHPDIAKFKNNPQRILAAIDHFASHERMLLTIGPIKAQIVADVIHECKPRTIVELGGYIGYSAIFFADQLQRSAGAGAGTAAAAAVNSEEGGVRLRYWSFELEPQFSAIAQELVDLAGLADVVTIVVGPSTEFLRRLHAAGQLEGIDLLYLDHNEDQLYVQDTKLCVEELGLLRSGARIVADNVLLPGAPEYRAYVRSQHEQGRFCSKGVKGMTVPGDLEDEVEITTVL